jgi:hypothetical protein
MELLAKLSICNGRASSPVIIRLKRIDVSISGKSLWGVGMARKVNIVTPA